MITNLTSKDLIEFEEEVCQRFENKEILAPFHADNGNECQLIEIFKNIKETDWVCCSWRSHYKCLLKGVGRDELMSAILRGKSISLNFPEYKIVSSAIVGGICPIALGLALAEKKKNSSNKVYVFLGDMTARTGIFRECYDYAVGQELPIVFIIEDNNKSVCTNTDKTWGSNTFMQFPNLIRSGGYFNENGNYYENLKEKLIYYFYESKYPHSGGLKRIQF